MTIIVSMAVKPKNGVKPYVLFGSDSLVVNYDFNNNNEIVGRNENQQKIFTIHNKLVSFMGLFSTDFIYKLIDHLENSTTVETEIEDVVEITRDFILSDIEKENSITMYITVLFGQINSKGNPILARIKLDREQFGEADIEFIEVERNPDYRFIVSGPDIPSNELVDKFLDELDANDSIDAVKKSAENFLKQLADCYPETCNQNININCLI